MNIRYSFYVIVQTSTEQFPYELKIATENYTMLSFLLTRYVTSSQAFCCTGAKVTNFINYRLNYLTECLKGQKNTQYVVKLFDFQHTAFIKFKIKNSILVSI